LDIVGHVDEAKGGLDGNGDDCAGPGNLHLLQVRCFEPMQVPTIVRDYISLKRQDARQEHKDPNPSQGSQEHKQKGDGRKYIKKI